VCDLRVSSETIVDFHDPLVLLEEHLKMEQNHFVSSKALEGYPFRGGWMGYMGYAATQYFDRIPQQSKAPVNVAEAFYGLYDTFLIFDYLRDEVLFISYREEREANELLDTLRANINRDFFETEIISENAEVSREIFKNVHDSMGREKFEAGVEQAKEYIREGEAFQIVLSHRFSLPISCDPIDIYQTLKTLNPSDYCFYFIIPGTHHSLPATPPRPSPLLRGGGKTVYLGTSPEAFVRSINRSVMIRALAGTRPRGMNSDEDERLELELKSNEKELAEHYMLIDLARNDLGRVCEIGSVRVEEIATVVRYTSVMHLATEVTGKLERSKSIYDLFRSCFPAGTVSGAPKIRAMQLLSALEQEQRGIYSGAVGYFDAFGNMDGALAIRSAVIQDSIAHVNTGAGIVYDSDPASEYMETRHKASAILRAIQLADHAYSHIYQDDLDAYLIN
jgi:anthranilate synthase component 1